MLTISFDVDDPSTVTELYIATGRLDAQSQWTEGPSKMANFVAASVLGVDAVYVTDDFGARIYYRFGSPRPSPKQG